MTCHRPPANRPLSGESDAQMYLKAICFVGMLASCGPGSRPIARSTMDRPTPSPNRRCQPRMRFFDLGPGVAARYRVWICGRYKTGRNRAVPFTYELRIGAQRTPATPTPWEDLEGLVGLGLEGHLASRPTIGDEVCVVFLGNELCSMTITATDLADLPAAPD